MTSQRFEPTLKLALFFFCRLRRAVAPARGAPRNEAPTNRNRTKKSANNGGAGAERGNKARRDEREHGRTGTAKKKAEQQNERPLKRERTEREQKQKRPQRTGESRRRKAHQRDRNHRA